MTSPFTDFGILYIDDELKSLKYFEAIFGDLAPIYIASSPEEGFAIFQEKHEKIGLVLSDKKMPNESGLELLKRIRAVDPKPLRFLVTAFSDLDVAVDALNDGLLYAYLTKPWDPDELEHRLVKAMNHFSLARERDRLIQEKSEAIEHLIMADKAASIGILSTGLNHHMRNALTVMRTFYDMLPYQLEEELDGEPKDAEFWNDYYNEVGSQIDRMTSMLSNLAEGTRLRRSVATDRVNLADVLAEAGAVVLKSHPEIRFTLTQEGEPLLITGDAKRISQMSRFLFEDSRSTLKNGGEIEILISSPQGTGMVETTFIDNGELLSEEDLARVFDPFFVRTNKPEELGTHLMACYLTVFQHGGWIRAERTEDGRNAVIFSLPVEAPKRRQVEGTRLYMNRMSESSGNDLRAASAELPA